MQKPSNSQDLRCLDIQLLIAFDALMTDPHVTRAAHAIGVSQPAMSHILSRLREIFGDPLLARTARGMAPTSRAQELVEPVRNALKQIRRILGTQSTFNPRTARDLFKVRMGDVSAYLFLPHILAKIEKEAPHVMFETCHLSPDETIKALDGDELDLGISTGISPPKSIRSMTLVADEMVCIMRKGHPSSTKTLTTKAFLALRHIKIAQSIVDEYIERQRLNREVALNTPHWLVALGVVESTDLITSVSRRMANLMNTSGRFELRPLPFAHPRFNWSMYWHRRYDEHPAHKWLRSVVMSTCQNRTSTF